MKPILLPCMVVLALLVPLSPAAASTNPPRAAPAWTEPYHNVGNFPLIPALGGTLGTLLGEGLVYGTARQALLGGALGAPLAIGIQALSQSAIDGHVDWGTAIGSGIGATLAPIAVTALLGAAAPGIPIFLASMAGSMVGTWAVQQIRARWGASSRDVAAIPGSAGPVTLLAVTSGGRSN